MSNTGITSEAVGTAGPPSSFCRLTQGQGADGQVRVTFQTGRKYHLKTAGNQLTVLAQYRKCTGDDYAVIATDNIANFVTVSES